MQLAPKYLSFSALVFLLVINNLFAQTNEPIPFELSENEKITREMKPKEIHDFTFNAEAGKCLHLVVEQQNMDVTVRLFDSQNNKLADIDRSNTIRGPERVTFVLSQTDTYKIKILASNFFVEPSGYSIELKPFTIPTENDFKRRKAEQLMSDAERQSLTKDPTNHKKAVNNFIEAIRIWNELADRYEQTVSQYGLGWMYIYSSEFENASYHFLEGAKTAKQIGELFMYAHCIRGAGQAFLNLGEFELADYNFGKSAQIFTDLDIPRYVAFALYSSGAVKRILRQYNESFVKLNRALEIRQQVNDSRGTLLTLVELARLRINQNQLDSALAYLNQALYVQQKNALEVQKNVKFEGDIEIYSAMGWVYLLKDEYPKAEELLQKVLKVRRRDATLSGEAESLSMLGLVYAGTEEWQKSIDCFDESVQVIENLRDRTQNQQLRMSFIEQIQFYYVNYIRVLMKLHQLKPNQGYDRKAFEISEKARARGLLNLLNQTTYFKYADTPLELSSENIKIQSIYAELLQELRQTKDETRKSEIVGRLEDIVRQKREIENKLRQLYVKSSANNNEINSLDSNEIQALLDKDTILLEFGLYGSVNNKTFPTYLWAITKHETAGFNLLPKAEIEEKVHRLYELLTSNNRSDSQLSEKERKLKMLNTENEVRKLSAELSDILIKPLLQNQNLLEGKKRLLIVSNGVLQSLPFSIIPFPMNSVDKPQLLLEKFEIINLPSASILKVLREKKKIRNPADKTAAVFADPIFTADDDRFAALKSSPPSNKNNLNQPLRTGNFFSQGNLPRLFNTRFEAATISSHLSENKKLIWLDFNANRETFLKTNWENYRILHFATHALIDDEQPELSGLILSMFDKNKHPLDGILLSGDISNLKLNADLVVLSGCRTAMGKQLSGEGYVGLTQNFMYAGASRVMSSLWAVDDRATAQLMTNFYNHLLGKKPQTPAESLRLAQLEMSKDIRWKNPYYWASFIIQGDF
jgi:CHAT domain-containing protein